SLFPLCSSQPPPPPRPTCATPPFPDPSSLSPFRRKLAPFPGTILLLLPPSSLFPQFFFVFLPRHHPRPPFSPSTPRLVATPFAGPFFLFPSSSLLPDHSPVFFLLLTPPFCICDCCNFEFGWSNAQVMKLMQREPRFLCAK
ncbi:unnamed protein product, partial [Musa banksii]